MNLQEIKDFRKQKDYHSTTHYMTLQEYIDMSVELIKTYTDFRVEKKLKSTLPYQWRTNKSLPLTMIQLTIYK